MSLLSEVICKCKFEFLFTLLPIALQLHCKLANPSHAKLRVHAAWRSCRAAWVITGWTWNTNTNAMLRQTVRHTHIQYSLSIIQLTSFTIYNIYSAELSSSLHLHSAQPLPLTPPLPIKARRNSYSAQFILYHCKFAHSHSQTKVKVKKCQEQDVEKEAKPRLVESQSRVQFELVYNSLLDGFIVCFAKVCCFWFVLCDLVNTYVL